MTNKKHAQLLAILTQIEALEKIAKEQQRHGKPNPTIYGSGHTLLFKGKRVEALRNWRERLKEAKMVRSAKNLTLAFDDDVKTAFIDLAERTKTKIVALNSSNLTPKTARMTKVVLDLFQTARLSFLGLYDNYMSDLFNQGRMHQVLLNPRAELMKKFAASTFEENDASTASYSAFKEGFIKKIARLEGKVLEELQDAVTASLNKSELTETLEAYVLANLDGFVALAHQHVQEVYAAGNLYQLAKDKTKWVRWQTGQHISDCGHCRAIQMGDVILTHEGKQIRHIKDNFSGIVYAFDDIFAIAKEKGAAYFNHPDCRCAFVAKIEKGAD